MTIRDVERAAMARARELGAAVLGTTSPNPAVGAVVLAADGTVAGEGATQPPGGPHAEVQALAQAGSAPGAGPPSSPSSRARTPAAPAPAPTR